MGSPSNQSKGHKNPQRRLHTLFQDPTTNDKVNYHHKPRCTSSQEQLPDGGIACSYAKEYIRTSHKPEISGFLQQTTFPGTQTLSWISVP